MIKAVETNSNLIEIRVQSKSANSFGRAKWHKDRQESKCRCDGN